MQKILKLLINIFIWNIVLRMSIIQKVLISLLLLVVVQNVSLCPADSITFETFDKIAEDALQFKSATSDVFYRLAE